MINDLPAEYRTHCCGGSGEELLETGLLIVTGLSVGSAASDVVAITSRHPSTRWNALVDIIGSSMTEGRQSVVRVILAL